jgi:AcrR family transcriptional regulator
MQSKPKQRNDLDRAQERRIQIVEAARQCVVRHGFHASTIADIAATAKMSVGLIYRYFANKDALALALVESVVNRRNTAPIPQHPEELSAGLVRMILSDPPPEQRKDQMLLLEVHVEATRNPVVAEIIERTDATIQERFLASIYKDVPAYDPEEAAARMEMLAAIVYGTTMRRLARPGQPSEKLVEVYRETISCLLQSKTRGSTAQAPGAPTEPVAAQDHTPNKGSAPGSAHRRLR